MRIVVRTLWMVPAAALFAAGAGARPGPQCTLAPFAYQVVSSRLADTGAFAYTATGTTTLSGATCPLAGRTVHVRESGSIADPRAGAKAPTGQYSAEWDLGDGTPNLTWHGKTRSINDQTPADWNEEVNAEGPHGKKLVLRQKATLNPSNPAGPLVSLALDAGFTIADD